MLLNTNRLLVSFKDRVVGLVMVVFYQKFSWNFAKVDAHNLPVWEKHVVLALALTDEVSPLHRLHQRRLLADRWSGKQVCRDSSGDWWSPPVVVPRVSQHNLVIGV